jgi:hypothetical protein
MKKLLKQYNLNSDMQYFEMIVESFINGQISQAKELFTALPKINRRDMVIAVTGSWNSGITKDQINILINLI